MSATQIFGYKGYSISNYIIRPLVKDYTHLLSQSDWKTRGFCRQIEDIKMSQIKESVALKRAVWSSSSRMMMNGKQDLTSETIEGSSLSLQGIDDIHGSDSLPLGMFSVGDGISDDVTYTEHAK